MIKDEVEPLGGFIGDAFVTPVFLGGQAITAMAFIIIQSVWLGLIAAAIVLVQAFLIPKLRKRILVLGRQRQLTARQLAGRVGEAVDGAVEIHANDTSNYERADFSTRLGKIFYIRYEIFQRKFFVKFLNNFLAQFTPFVFYSLGGILAIQGQLDIGALVAVIAAYKDLPSPIKELIDWDQQRNDIQIKYDQVIEQFQPPDMIEPWVQDPETPEPEPLSGSRRRALPGTSPTISRSSATAAAARSTWACCWPDSCSPHRATSRSVGGIFPSSPRRSQAGGSPMSGRTPTYFPIPFTKTSSTASSTGP
jgi:putative ABC transport system ATP-binding protein